MKIEMKNHVVANVVANVVNANVVVVVVYGKLYVKYVDVCFILKE